MQQNATYDKKSRNRRTGGATKRSRAREPKAGYARAPPEIAGGRATMPEGREQARKRLAARDEEYERARLRALAVSIRSLKKPRKDTKQ